MGFPGGTVGKEPACQCRRHKRGEFNPGSGRSPGGGNSNPLQYSCLENRMDRGAWRAISMGSHLRARAHTHTHTHTLLLMVEAAVMVGNTAVSHLRPYLINEFVWIPSQS